MCAVPLIYYIHSYYFLHSKITIACKAAALLLDKAALEVFTWIKIVFSEFLDSALVFACNTSPEIELAWIVQRFNLEYFKYFSKIFVFDRCIGTSIRNVYQNMVYNINLTRLKY